jgi:hypothetical protein
VRVPFDLLAIKLVVGLTTAGSGVTKFRLGLWTYTGTTLTLVAATADQSTAVNNGGNVGAFAPALAVAADMSTPLTQYQLTRGNWYGFSQLTVGGTSPKFQGLNNGLSGTLNLDPFMLYANNNSGSTWTDYAANQTLTSVTSGSSATYVYMGAASV